MLNTLILVDTSLNVSFSKPSAIVNLHVICTYVEGYNLSEILKNCPRLETLRCSGFDNFATPPFPLVDYIITLPNLTLLALDITCTVRTAQLLSYISIPQNCAVDIETRISTRAVNAVGYSMLPAHVDTNLKCFSGIRRLEIHPSPDNGLSVIVHAFHDPNNGTEEPPVKLNIASTLPATFYSGWPFDVSHVETLVLSRAYARISPNHWIPMLQSMPALKNLRVLVPGVKNAEALLDTLHCMKEDGHDTASEKTFAVCPLLSVLELYDISKFPSLSSKLLALILARYSHGKLREVELFNVGGIDAKSPWVSALEEHSPGLTIRTE